jgi:hypothetical protein
MDEPESTGRFSHSGYEDLLFIHLVSCFKNDRFWHTSSYPLETVVLGAKICAKTRVKIKVPVLGNVNKF